MHHMVTLLRHFFSSFFKYSAKAVFLEGWSKTDFLIFVLWCFKDTLIDLFRNVDRLQADLRDVAGMSRESVEMLLKMPLPENRTQASLLS